MVVGGFIRWIRLRHWKFIHDVAHFLNLVKLCLGAWENFLCSVSVRRIFIHGLHRMVFGALEGQDSLVWNLYFSSMGILQCSRFIVYRYLANGKRNQELTVLLFWIQVQTI
jgi:hypothetical protein